MFGFKSAIVLVLFGHLLEAKLPDFIEPCSRNRATINKCLEERANEVLEELLKGVEEINVPPLAGFKLPEIRSPPYASYRLVFDGFLGSLAGVNYTHSIADLDGLLVYGKLRFPKLELNGKYKIDGFVGSEPIRGNGTATITLDDSAYDIIWIFETQNRNGTEYLQVKQSTLLSYELKLVNYDFDNLFDGNKVQETEANNYLNRNWEILEGNFSPYVADLIHKISFELGNRVLDSTPFVEVLPP